MKALLSRLLSWLRPKRQYLISYLYQNECDTWGYSRTCTSAIRKQLNYKDLQQIEEALEKEYEYKLVVVQTVSRLGLEPEDNYY